MTDFALGMSGIILNGIVTASTSGLREEVSAWVTLGCTLTIAVCTCVVQVWRLWRDRNNDKKK